MKKKLFYILAVMILSLSFSLPVFADGQEDGYPPIDDHETEYANGGGNARADEAEYQSSGKKPPLTDEEKGYIESACRFASVQFRSIYVAAQSGTPQQASKARIMKKLKAKPLKNYNHEIFASAIVEEAYNLYYQYGKLKKVDTQEAFRDNYFRSCMKNAISSQ